MARELTDILQDAIHAARLGGTRTRPKLGKLSAGDVELKTTHKDWNPVTALDRSVEKEMAVFLRERYPEHGFLGEEGVANRSGSADHLWILDPIDGTANFIHGIPHYGVSIAYAHGGVVLAAACLDPVREELFTALRGKGAWLNGQPISASAATRLSDAIVCTGFYYDRGEMMNRTLSTMRKLFNRRIHGIRRSGSAVLDICWTAAGRYDAYFEYELSSWDFAGAALVAEEAGAKVSTADGAPLTLASASFACAAPSVYSELLKII
jgi:myo-inositol-1(or 4)-monophosphatase